MLRLLLLEEVLLLHLHHHQHFGGHLLLLLLHVHGMRMLLLVLVLLLHGRWRPAPGWRAFLLLLRLLLRLLRSAKQVAQLHFGARQTTGSCGSLGRSCRGF